MCAQVPGVTFGTPRIKLDLRRRIKGIPMRYIPGALTTPPSWQWRAGQRTTKRRPNTVKDTVVGNHRSRVFYLPGCPGHAGV
jgi:hypothetical protein